MPNNTSETTKLNRVNKIEIIQIFIGVMMIISSFGIGISDNPPGIFLLLLGFILTLFVILSHFGKSNNLKPLQKLIYWSPRVICIITALFLSIFALDVFQEYNSFWHICMALFMHLIPTFILIAILIISWKREWFGGILFNLLGIIYIIMAWGRFPFSTYLLISGPLFVTGTLFLINWKYKKIFFEDLT